jgi:hypothetical protein
MKYVVVLGIGRRSVPAKVARLREVILQSTGNINLPSPIPTLATLTTLTNQAEAAYLKAKTGRPDDTANMRNKVAALELALKQFAGYVEAIANKDLATAETVILSAGFKVKGRKPRQVRTFDAKPTGIPGEVKVTHKAEPNAAYEFQISTDISNEANWRSFALTTKSRIVKGGLEPDTRYSFRGRVITKDGPGEWSEVRVVYLTA